MNNKIFKFNVILFFIFFIKFVFATGNINDINLNDTSVYDCNRVKYDIIGDFNLKINSQSNYIIKDIISGNSSKIIANYKIYKNDKIILDENNEKIKFSSQKSGLYKLFVNLKDDGTGCIYNVEKEINVYSKIIYYITDNKNINLSLKEDFLKNDIYFEEVNLNSNINSLQDDFLSRITEKISLFDNSDILIINSDKFLDILQSMSKLNLIYNIDLSKKKIFIFTNTGFALSKKILGNYINLLYLNIFTANPEFLLNFINYLSTGKSSTDLTDKGLYGLMKISFESQTNDLLFLTNFTNKLIVSGFPINILGIFFALSIAFSIGSFVKHVIGFTVFNLYNPILLALSFYLFDTKIILLLFFTSLIGFYFLNIFYNKIHLLSNSKISTYLVFYIILSLSSFGILNHYGLINFNIIKFDFIIFPFIIIPMIVYKVYNIEKKIFSFGFIFYNLEFIFILGISYFILKNSFIQNIFLAYTELLFLVLITNILIGRFVGLQLVEYIRFLPLIKKSFHTEEE